MRKVLIAIDYSPAAQKVAEMGYALGKAMQAEIVLLHVMEEEHYYASTIYDPIMGFGGFVNINLLSRDTANYIVHGAEMFLNKTKQHLADNNIKTMVLHGNISETIIETAHKEKCQLIVMGTHSRNMVEEILLGSTANKLVRHSPIPLYIIPVKVN
ncbi:MAG: universal stress protein [Chitinophagaceae bacterium]